MPPNQAVVLVTSESTIVTVAAPGPAGPPGPPGPQGIPGLAGDVAAQLRWTAPAAVNLSGHRAVTARPDGSLEYASNTNPAHLAAPIWVTTQAAGVGDDVDVVVFGVLDEPTWSWTPGPIYLGAGGLLVQTPPTAAGGTLFLAQVAVATASGRIFVDRHPSISLI